MKGLITDMKSNILIVLSLASALLLGGCGNASMHHGHAARLAPAAAPPTQPAVTPTRSAINTAQGISICKNVKAWLPAAWSQDPPNFSARLVSDAMKAQGTLQADLADLETNVQDLSPGQYMGTSTGIEAVQRDCAALGVKIKLPSVPPAATCWKRFRRWQHGPVHFEISSMEGAMSSFSKNSNSSIYTAVVFLHIAADAARLAKRWPMPACADPGGYWHTMLTYEHRMGLDVGSPLSAATNGYLPNAAISDQQKADSAFRNLRSELAHSTGHHPFG